MIEEYKMTFKRNLKYSIFILLYLLLAPLTGIWFLFLPVGSLEGLLRGCLICFVVTGMFWLPGILLHLSYYFNDKKREIRIHKCGIGLIKENTSSFIKYQEILKIEKHIGNNSWKLPWNEYGFIKITTKDGAIKITCLLIDPLSLTLNLSRNCDCKIEVFAHGIPYF